MTETERTSDYKITARTTETSTRRGQITEIRNEDIIMTESRNVDKLHQHARRTKITKTNDGEKGRGQTAVHVTRPNDGNT